MPYLGNPAQQRFSSPRAASVYSGDGSTVAFTLEEVVTTDEDILVSVDGVIQEPSVAYAVSSGTTLTFTAAPSTNSGNNIFVYYIARTFGSVSMPDGQNVNAATASFSGALTASSTAAITGNTTVGGTLGVGSTNTPTSSSGGNLIAIETTADEHTNLVFNTANTAKNGIIEGRRTGRGSYERFAQINLQNDSDNGEIRFYTAASGSDVSEKMRIDSTGAVTKPLQPAFLVKPSTQQDNINGDGSDVDVAFGSEIFDNNADFASSTFTAPVTGRYFFTVSLRFENADTASAYVQIYLKTSNRIIKSIQSTNVFSGDIPYLHVHMTSLSDMDANDTCKIQLQLEGSGASQADVDPESFFSGHLVC